MMPKQIKNVTKNKKFLENKDFIMLPPYLKRAPLFLLHSKKYSGRASDNT